MEVVQRDYPTDYCCKSPRDLRVGRVRVVRLAVHVEPVDRGAKGGPDLPGRAAEQNHAARGWDGFDIETVAGEPIDYLTDVVAGNAKQISKRFGREPLMVLRRTGVLLGGYQIVKGLLLRLIRLQYQHHAVHAMFRWNGSGIELRARERMSVSISNHTKPVVYGGSHSIGGLNGAEINCRMRVGGQFLCLGLYCKHQDAR